MVCVEDLSAALAACRVEGFPHSIADLVFHMNYWMGYELRRIRSEKPEYPEHNAESFPDMPIPVDVEKWERLREDFAGFLAEFGELAHSSEAELQREIESAHDGDKKVASSLGSVLCQMVAHNSYHVGQIAMIRRMLGVWPPTGGGDTW
jgi:uncharacterized damage-inducible protein DinB